VIEINPVILKSNMADSVQILNGKSYYNPTAICPVTLQSGELVCYGSEEVEEVLNLQAAAL